MSYETANWEEREGAGNQLVYSPPNAGFGRGYSSRNNGPYGAPSGNGDGYRSNFNQKPPRGMARGRFDDGENYCAEGDETVITVDSRKVGRIVGRQGSKIRELEETTGCRINISKSPNADSTTSVTLSGAEESRNHAKSLIEDLVGDNQSFGNRSENRSWRGGDSDRFGGSDTKQIFVSNNHVGRIIGKGGCKIRDLQDQSGCQIKVKKDGVTGMETPVELMGTPDAVARAEGLIHELTADSFPSEGGWDGQSFGRGENRSWRGRDNDRFAENDQSGFWANSRSDAKEIFVSNNVVGKIIGKGGSKIRDLQDQSGCQIKVRKEGATAMETPIDLMGSPDAVARAEQLIVGLTTESFSSFGSNSRSESKEIFVSNSHVGRIIGKGGSKIRELQEQSGCQIKIQQDGASDMDTPIELIGSPDAIARAEELVNELTADTFSSRF